MAEQDLDTFAGVKSRLDEIVEAVSDDNMPLDDALKLYEEAVTLGLRASTLLEADIAAQDAEEAEEDAEGEAASSAEEQPASQGAAE